LRYHAKSTKESNVSRRQRFTLAEEEPAVLGGIGTPLGPVIGAFLLTFIQETLWKNFTNLHAVLFGAAIVVVVLLMPRGIVYLIRQKFSWRIFVRNLRQYRV